MLALTQNAAQAVDAIINQPGLPDDAGLRITAAQAPTPEAGASPDLQLTVVESPEPEDQVIEGASIYVEPDTAEYLTDKVLDAEVAENQVRFSLHDKPAD